MNPIFIVLAIVIGIPLLVVVLGMLDAALMYRDMQRGYGPCWPKDEDG